MSYKEVYEVLKHWKICTAHGSSCHVVDRECRSRETIITRKQIVVMTHAEKTRSSVILQCLGSPGRRAGSGTSGQLAQSRGLLLVAIL